MKKPVYIGRFAPSPSGHLHFGSLVCALASFLDAKSNNGRWLIRMEDSDPPRELVGAAENIIAVLRLHGLCSDSPVLFQSKRTFTYQHTVEQLLDNGIAFKCDCSRQQVKKMNGVYDGRCISNNKVSEPYAIRLTLPQDTSKLTFNDQIQGILSLPQSQLCHYPIIVRRDRLFAYNLAVVLDDIYQGITHIVRGADLINTTFIQIKIYQLLGEPIPYYAHIPVAAVAPNVKLSKQNHAPALNLSQPASNIRQALSFLNIDITDANQYSNVDDLLIYAIAQWQLNNVPKQLERLI